MKAAANLDKHGLSFADAHRVFDGPTVVAADYYLDDGEERWSLTGLLGATEVVIVYSEPEAGASRIISMLRATPHERRRFWQEVPF